jgi:tyrosyl-tRNA synthetase
MYNYFEVLTTVPMEEVKMLVDAKHTHPMEAKKRLAEETMAPYFPQEEIQRSRQEWEAIHQKKSSSGEVVVPEGTPTVTVSDDLMEDGEVPVIKLAVHCGFGTSNSEVRRLVKERGIKLNGEPLTDPNGRISVRSGDVLQRGKRKYVRLEVSNGG